MASIKVPARALQRGDVTGSGETIVSATAGVRTPRGKVEVTLEKGERSRLALWGASTLISVTRRAPAATVAVKVETLSLILSELAATALGPDSEALAAYDVALTSSLTTLQLICSTVADEPRKEMKRQ